MKLKTNNVLSQPDYLIMTNIDFDHPDYFKDIEDVFDIKHSKHLNIVSVNPQNKTSKSIKV